MGIENNFHTRLLFSSVCQLFGAFNPNEQIESTVKRINILYGCVCVPAFIVISITYVCALVKRLCSALYP